MFTKGHKLSEESLAKPRQKARRPRYTKHLGENALDRKLRFDYGISEEEFNALLKEQNGVCRICGNPNGKGHRLCVDHDHTTKKVRGLLCHNCNRAIGFFKENKDLIYTAYCYLDSRG